MDKNIIGKGENSIGDLFENPEGEKKESRKEGDVGQSCPESGVCMGSFGITWEPIRRARLQGLFSTYWEYVGRMGTQGSV